MKTIATKTCALVNSLMLGLLSLHGADSNQLKLYDFPGSCICSKMNPGIATGPSWGSYIRIGEDISRLCATIGYSKKDCPDCYCQEPRFRLNVIATRGGFDGVKRLREEGEVQLAIVPSDVHYFAKKQCEETMIPREKRKSWAALANDIRLVLPLYTEPIHIIIRPEDRAKYQDLYSLFEKGARVNVGKKGSGTMITSSLIEQLVLDWKRENLRTWRPHYESDDVALRKLLKDKQIDAVILVGAEPHPALERYARREMEQEIGGLLGIQSVNRKAHMAFLPFGRADQAIKGDAGLNYVQTMLNQSPNGESNRTPYQYLTGNQNPVSTWGVTACLVTHGCYDKTTNSHKIAWVAHVLHRILTNLDETHGLDRDAIEPAAGREVWRQLWKNLDQMVQNPDDHHNWKSYGWKIHNDPVLVKVLSSWKDLAKNSRVIAPFDADPLMRKR